jgi:hypothetical protein
MSNFRSFSIYTNDEKVVFVSRTPILAHSVYNFSRPDENRVALKLGSKVKKHWILFNCFFIVRELDHIFGPWMIILKEAAYIQPLLWRVCWKNAGMFLLYSNIIIAKVYSLSIIFCFYCFFLLSSKLIGWFKFYGSLPCFRILA